MELKGRFDGRMPFLVVEIGGQRLSVLVDTGYDGDLLLPEALIGTLKLPYLAGTRYQTADGKIASGSSYLAELEWLGVKRKVVVDSTEGEHSLLGMGLLDSCRLEMEPSRKHLLIARQFLS